MDRDTFIKRYSQTNEGKRPRLIFEAPGVGRLAIGSEDGLAHTSNMSPRNRSYCITDVVDQRAGLKLVTYTAGGFAVKIVYDEHIGGRGTLTLNGAPARAYSQEDNYRTPRSANGAPLHK